MAFGGVGGFSDPIAGLNGKLVRQQLESDNFATGVSGWRIARDGTAEFNQVTVRGGVVVTQGETILIYSGATPSAGTLVISISPTAGTDPYGNSYPEGFRLYGLSSNAGAGITVGYTGTSPLVIFEGVVPNVAGDANIQLNHQGAGNGQASFLTILSAKDNAQLDSVATNWFASSHDGTQKALISEAYIDSAGSAHFYKHTSYSGHVIDAGSITGVHPGTGTSGANPAVAETWQTPSLGTGWATEDTSAVIQPLQYRMQPDGSVWLYGAIHATINGASSTLFTLPSAYTPTTWDQIMTISHNIAGTKSVNEILITTAGAVIIDTVPGINTNVYINAIYRIN